MWIYRLTRSDTILLEFLHSQNKKTLRCTLLERFIPFDDPMLRITIADRLLIYSKVFHIPLYSIDIVQGVL